jgi:hypothetical protein
MFVIPAKAGTQGYETMPYLTLGPGVRGDDGFRVKG